MIVTPQSLFFPQIMRIIANIFTVYLLLYPIPVFTQVTEKFCKWQEKPVLGVQFSPDGKYIASVCADKTIQIYNVSTGDLVSSLTENTKGDISIDFSPDGSSLASVSLDQSVKILDVSSGKIVRTYTGHSKAIRTAIYHPSGNFIASSGWDNEIKIWFAHSGITLKTLKGHTQCVRALDFSPDGSYLASSGYDLNMIIWGINTGEQIFTVKAHNYPIESICFSPDGQFVCTGSSDNTLKIWGINEKKLLFTLQGHTEGVYSVDYSPDGRYIVSSSNDKTAIIWDTSTGKSVQKLTGHTLGLRMAVFNPNGESLVTCGIDKSIRVWNVSHLEIKGDINLKPCKPPSTSDLIDWRLPIRDVFDVLHREFTVEVEVDSSLFGQLKLYINKEEYVEYEDTTILIPDASVTKSEDGKSWIARWNAYLHLGENELQVVAIKNNCKNFSFSSIRTIYCHDLSKLAANPTFYHYDITIPSYQEKSMMVSYVPSDKSKFCDILKTQYKKLYKSLVHYQMNSADSSTKSVIINSFNNFTTKYDDNSVVFVSLCGILACDHEKQNYYLLPSSFNKKSGLEEAINLSDIFAKIKGSPSHIYFFINVSQTIEKVGKLQGIDVESFSFFLANKIGDWENTGLLLLNGKPTDPVFDQLANSFHIENDKDHNLAIDFIEMTNFMRQVTPIYTSFKGYRQPLFVHID